MLLNLSNLYLIQNAARPNLLKDIVFNPFILPLLGTIAFLYILVFFNYLDKDKKLGYWLERSLATAYIFLISGGGAGISMNPFNRLFPGGLAVNGTSPMLKGMLIAIYIMCLLLLAGRLSQTLKNYIYSVAMMAQKDPGLIIILFLNLFSASWSQTPPETVQHSLVLIMISLVAIYVGKQFSWTEIHLMIRWVAAFIIILSLRNQGIGADGNWTGILIHKNPFSFEMAQGVIWWLLQAFYQPEYRRRSILFVALCLFGLQKGGSGASKIIIIILIGLWGYVGILKKLPVKWAFLSVVIFLILGINATIWVTDNLHFIIVDKLNKDITLTGRTEFWPQIWEHILQNPMGYGTDSYFQPFRGADNPAFSLRTGTGFRPPSAHNGVLQMGTEIGFLGMGCLIVSFFNNLSRAVIHLSQAEQPEASIPLQLITYLILTNLTESNFMGVNSLWFLYIVMSTRFSIDIQGGMTKSDKLRKQKLKERKVALRSG
jgi:exopolysaccharide production protein ExoQ